jgi:hypothetical protein
MEVHGYTASGAISITIEGTILNVPDDPTNRHRQMIAEWEAEGNTIPPYVPPSTPEPSDDEIISQAMREDFIDRMAKNVSAPKSVKEAAIRIKAREGK